MKELFLLAILFIIVVFIALEFSGNNHYLRGGSEKLKEKYDVGGNGKNKKVHFCPRRNERHYNKKSGDIIKDTSHCL